MAKETLIKSKERVKKFAEVFTPEWVVHKMLDMLDEDSPKVVEDIHSTILEPACGEGAFITRVYERRLPHCKTNWERLIALSTLYGVEIQEDNALICRQKLFDLAMGAYDESGQDTINEAIVYASYAMLITAKNIILDDFLWNQENIKFTTWQPVEEYKFKTWETCLLDMKSEADKKAYYKEKKKRFGKEVDKDVA